MKRFKVILTKGFPTALGYYYSKLEYHVRAKDAAGAERIACEMASDWCWKQTCADSVTLLDDYPMDKFSKVFDAMRDMVKDMSLVEVENLKTTTQLVFERLGGDPLVHQAQMSLLDVAIKEKKETK